MKFISGTDEPVDDFPYLPEPPSGTPGRKSLKMLKYCIQ